LGSKGIIFQSRSTVHALVEVVPSGVIALFSAEHNFHSDTPHRNGTWQFLDG